MKKYGFVLLAFLFIVAVAAAQYPAAAPAQAAGQAKPFTAKFFGPWNADVAKTHVPMVKVEKAAAGHKVTVQIDNHPMDAQKPHYIERIWVEDEKGNKLGEKTFQPTDPGPPTAEFEIAGTHSKLKVFEHCNVHGTWLHETAVPK